MIKAVVFDCFGVLMLSSHQSLRERFPAHGDRLLELENQANAGFLDSTDYVEQIAELTELTVSEVEEWLLSEHNINTALVEVIKGLRKHSYTIGMLSNLGGGWMERYVDASVRDLFDEVVVSGEVGMYKPNPEIYEYMSNKLYLHPNEILFIDDRSENVEAARAVGMEAVQFIGNTQLTKDFLAYSVRVH
jgi:epoxide hydrolase-like predicted phosphatase